jgi:molecular chaperone DnaK
VEARNTAENAAYQAEKQLGEMEGIDDSAKSDIEQAIKDVREVLGSEDVAEIQAKTNALQEAFHKVSEQIYAQAAQQQAQAAGDGAQAGADGAPAGEADEEVVDAEVVDGDERK